LKISTRAEQVCTNCIDGKRKFLETLVSKRRFGDFAAYASGIGASRRSSKTRPSEAIVFWRGAAAE